MANLNLNFHETTGRRELTKKEIWQIEGVASSIKDIIKALHSYAADCCEDPEGRQQIGGVCVSVCHVVELLIDPVLEYLSNYAGDEAAPEK